MAQVHDLEALGNIAKGVIRKQENPVEHFNLQRLGVTSTRIRNVFEGINHLRVQREVNNFPFQTVDIPVELEQHKDLDVVFSVGVRPEKKDVFIGVYFYKKGQKQFPVAQMSYALRQKHIQALSIETRQYEDVYAVHPDFGKHLDVIDEFLHAIEIGRQQ